MKLEFCAVCGTKDDLHHHHIIPRSQGGGDEETNLITLCTIHHAWIHSVRPGAWNNNSNIITESLREAKELGFPLGRPTAMTEEKIDKVEKLREEGMSIKQIAKNFEIGVGTVYNILNNPEECRKSVRKQLACTEKHGAKTYKEYKAELRKEKCERDKKLKELETAERKEQIILEKIKEKENRKIEREVEKLKARTETKLILEAEKCEELFTKQTEKLRANLAKKVNYWFEQEEDKFDKKIEEFIEKRNDIIEEHGFKTR